jgi:hypothetical protein
MREISVGELIRAYRGRRHDARLRSARRSSDPRTPPKQRRATLLARAGTERQACSTMVDLFTRVAMTNGTRAAR